MEGSTRTPTVADRPDLPLALAGVAVLLLVIFGIAGIDGPIWLIVGAFGAGAAITGWRAGGGRPQGLTLAATAVGALIALLVIIWGIASA